MVAAGVAHGQRAGARVEHGEGVGRKRNPGLEQEILGAEPLEAQPGGRGGSRGKGVAPATCRRRIHGHRSNEVGRHVVGAGEQELVGVPGWHQQHRIAFHPDGEAGLLGYVVKDGTERDVVELEVDLPGQGLFGQFAAFFAELEEDRDAAAGGILRLGVGHARQARKIIDRLGQCRPVEAHLAQHQRLHLAIQRQGPVAGRDLRAGLGLAHGLAGEAVDGLGVGRFPLLVDLAQHPGTGVVARGFERPDDRPLGLLKPGAGGDVVGINQQHIVEGFGGLVVTPELVERFGLPQRSLHLPHAQGQGRRGGRRVTVGVAHLVAEDPGRAVQGRHRRVEHARNQRAGLVVARQPRQSFGFRRAGFGERKRRFLADGLGGGGVGQAAPRLVEAGQRLRCIAFRSQGAPFFNPGGCGGQFGFALAQLLVGGPGHSGRRWYVPCRQPRKHASRTNQKEQREKDSGIEVAGHGCQFIHQSKGMARRKAICHGGVKDFAGWPSSMRYR